MARSIAAINQRGTFRHQIDRVALLGQNPCRTGMRAPLVAVAAALLAAIIAPVLAQSCETFAGACSLSLRGAYRRPPDAPQAIRRDARASSAAPPSGCRRTPPKLKWPPYSTRRRTLRFFVRIFARDWCSRTAHADARLAVSFANLAPECINAAVSFLCRQAFPICVPVTGSAGPSTAFLRYCTDASFQSRCTRLSVLMLVWSVT